MSRRISNDIISELKISARLVAEAAKARDYELMFCDKTESDTGSPLIIAVKNGREIYFKNLYTELNSSLSSFIERDKITAYDILARESLPTPRTLILRRSVADQDFSQEVIDFLVKFAPLVIKPSNTDHGNGITVGIDDVADLRTAVDYAMQKSTDADILLQQKVDGDEFRFLVLSGKVIAVANRQPPFVIGDGTKTIRELLNIKHADPRRGIGHSSPLTKIDSEEVLHFLGKGGLERVPKLSKKVQLLKTSNLSRGGESIDVTEIASPRLKEMAECAAKACLLGIAGVDIITTDIERGNEKNSMIIEVNASPGIRMHQFPSIGQSRDVAAMIWDELEKLPIAAI